MKIDKIILYNVTKKNLNFKNSMVFFIYHACCMQVSTSISKDKSSPCLEYIHLFKFLLKVDNISSPLLQNPKVITYHI